ncbi:hypothetical protein MT347_05655 [Microbacterium sp. VKM Ac-2923]|nr:hypothetical protein [Microbacterium sp. VKM Ac-2923]MCJ1707137.1 hypothetical protein [Microbacterium sp. VKM Ac-2923]
MEEHPRRRLVDVLADRNQPSICLLDGEVDRNVVGSTAGESINLVDDDEVDWVLSDELKHPLQIGPICGTCGFASIDEFLHDLCAKGLGLTPIGLPLGRKAIAFGIAVTFCLLTCRNPKVGNGGEFRCSRNPGRGSGVIHGHSFLRRVRSS